MNRPLDSRQLRAFATLAEAGSFTLAAKKLFLSQSAISHSMRALEQDVGCRLLDRVRKKIVLTQAGEQLLHYASRILSEMEEARDSLQELSKWGKGRLRLGASSTACQYLLPTVLRELKKSFPQCQISIEPVDTERALELLNSRRIDLAVALQPASEVSMEFIPLFTDELVFLLAPQHPWALQGYVTRTEIPRQNYILYRKASYTFRLVEDYFRQEHMVLNTLIELGSMEAIKELVKLGLGVSILAPWTAHTEITEGSLVALPLGRRKLKRQWGILHWRDRRLTYAEETFIKLCRPVVSLFENRTAEIASKEPASSSAPQHTP